MRVPGDGGRVAFLLEQLSAVGHDLRSPISSLLLGIQRLGRFGPADAARAPALLARMERSVRGMDRLVETLLDLGRLESGRLELERTGDAPAAVAARAVAGVGGGVGDGRRAIAVDAPDGLPAPAWDGPKTARAVAHLLAQALEFSPEGGTVWLSAREEAGGVRFDVEDAGPPLAPGEAAALFDGRADGPGARIRSRAHGPFLYLARRLAEVQGGRAEAGPGARGGARVSLWIPLAAR